MCDARPDEFLRAALRGGVDIVQLRMKRAPDAEILRAARRFRDLSHEHGALFILNDRPDLVLKAGADGVHLGQDDEPVQAARDVVGDERLIGLSTHSEHQIDSAHGMDYIGVGPVHATPTKPGRAPVGVGLIRYAGIRFSLPFFAIGGIDEQNVGAVRSAGATRIAVVRALTEASDPEGTARRLRRAVTSKEEALVGSA